MMEIRAGSWVGPYKIVEPLEEGAVGGMATLFQAELVRREEEGTYPVILKIVPAEEEAYDERGALRLEALRREVEILQRLRHPNIVRIYPIPSRDRRRERYIARATNVPGDPWYCTMEYLKEGSLGSRLEEEGVLPLKKAVEIAYQIGVALDYMHSKGYVHWDVKPDNILFRYDLSQDDSRDVLEVVLTDFGIARRTHEPGVVAGSVPYMSPERLRVHLGEIPSDQVMDQRPADVYALGVVLYEMLAGSLPFAAEDEEDLKSAILEDSPIPLTDFNREIPPVVEDVILRALEKNPANRPTIEEMVKMLERAVPAPRVGVLPSEEIRPEREAPPAPPPPVEVPAREPSLLDRVARGALIVAAAVALLFGGQWLWYRFVAEPPQARAITPSSVLATEGSVTVTIAGEHFDEDVDVFLTGGPSADIPCAVARVYDRGRKVQCSLNIDEADAGRWGVMVSSDRESELLPGAFEIVMPTPTPAPTPRPPTVDVGGPYEGQRIEEIILDGGGSTDPDGVIANYEWQVDGRQIYSGPDPTYQLDLSQYSPGDYTVRLVVTDEDGATSDAETIMRVSNAPPTANAGGPYTGRQNEAVTLDGTGSEDRDGRITAYTWEIDGEEVCSEATCEVELRNYDPDEDHTVKLIVTDDDGDSEETTTDLTVETTTAAAVVAGPVTPLSPLGGCYSGSPVLSWSGNGTTLHLRNLRTGASQMANVAGQSTYQTQLPADQWGAWEWWIDDSPHSSFTYDPIRQCKPDKEKEKEKEK